MTQHSPIQNKQAHKQRKTNIPRTKYDNTNNDATLTSTKQTNKHTNKNKTTKNKQTHSGHQHCNTNNNNNNHHKKKKYGTHPGSPRLKNQNILTQSYNHHKETTITTITESFTCTIPPPSIVQVGRAVPT